MRPRYHGITIAVTLTLFAFLSVLGGSAEARGEGHEGGEHRSGGFGACPEGWTPVVPR